MSLPPARPQGDGLPEGEAAYLLDLPEGLLAFQGHFPGNPILPGVVQVDWAVRLAQEAFPGLGPFLGVDHLKFTEITRPGENLALRLQCSEDRARVRFAFTAGDARKSTGQIRFATPEGQP